MSKLIISLLLSTFIVTTALGKTCVRKGGSRGYAEPEDRRKGCIGYGGYCDRENQNDNCCLMKGGTCRTVVGRGRICAPKTSSSKLADPSYTTFRMYNFFVENFIDYPGWTGGAYFPTTPSTARKMTLVEAGNPVANDEIISLKPILADQSFCSGNVILGRESYKCTKKGIKDNILYVSGNRNDALIFEVNTGVIVVMHDKYLVEDMDAVSLVKYWMKRMKDYSW